MTIGRLAQRNELDLKIDDQEYRVDYELDPKNKAVIVGEVKKCKDAFDTRCQLVFQDDEPELFEEIQLHIEDYLWYQV